MFWEVVHGPALLQGDLLVNCPFPLIPEDFRLTDQPQEVKFQSADLIVVTQSCDLENNKIEHVALCPFYTVAEFKKTNPEKKAKYLNDLRNGRISSLHLLASRVDPNNNESALIVDFKVVVSLPYAFLRNHAASIGQRFRLRSPYLEHFSQAFARFFMRVGLPSQIPEFR